MGKREDEKSVAVCVVFLIGFVLVSGWSPAMVPFVDAKKKSSAGDTGGGGRTKGSGTETGGRTPSGGTPSGTEGGTTTGGGTTGGAPGTSRNGATPTVLYIQGVGYVELTGIQNAGKGQATITYFVLVPTK